MSTTATKPQSLNGLNLSQMFETIDSIKQSPDLAKFIFRAKNEWLGGTHNRTTWKDFYGAGREDTSREQEFVFDNDEPTVLLGENKGANPVEFVLHALAGCLTSTMVLHAAKQGIPLQSVRSTLEGEMDAQGLLGLDETVRNGYQNLTVTFDIEGDITEEQKQELLDLTTSRSPITDIIRNPIDLEIRLR